MSSTTLKTPASRTAIVVGCAALVASLAGASVPSAPAARAATDQGSRCEGSVPFTAETEGYNAFRIPAIVATRSGTLLAFAEGRLASLSDAGNIDLVLKRSTDGGCTWGPLQVVHDSGPNTAGNPAPVVTATGRVVLLSTYNGGTASEAAIMRGEVPAEQSRRVFVQHSDDDGASWSAPREITAQAKAENWRWYATGPGHAIRLTGGTHRNRLVVPANHSIAPPAGSADLGTEAKYYGGHLLYSDDAGESWRIGSVDDNPNGYINVNESTVAELPDGRLYVNTREHNGSAPGNRADAYSRDGGESLELPHRPQATLVAPVVQGSVLQLTGASNQLLFSGPADPNSRAALTLRMSTDHGATWRPALALSGLPAAYSDLVQLAPDTVGVLYETGNFGANETITFRRVPVAQLRP
ncbi:sialidase family protein [Micromonospora halotolerans]|uniref:exo-alpha-sialidase n=1 Tax=Micromonospora halotolerans TaxID=709879 RepID=A0ABY9ZV79_9ACTN|nr:sialidase family protein [Micromonospora halotolerans]WNM39199.1 sialidase family protein [Micromonospora halotolerans]